MSSKIQYFFVEVTRAQGAATEADLLAQRSFLQKLTERDMLVLSGPLADVPGRGIAIVMATDIDEAKRIYKDAPLVLKGAAEVAIHPLDVAYGTLLESD